MEEALKNSEVDLQLLSHLSPRSQLNTLINRKMESLVQVQLSLNGQAPNLRNFTPAKDLCIKVRKSDVSQSGLSSATLPHRVSEIYNEKIDNASQTVHPLNTEEAMKTESRVFTPQSNEPIDIFSEETNHPLELAKKQSLSSIPMQTERAANNHNIIPESIGLNNSSFFVSKSNKTNTVLGRNPGEISQT